MFREIFCLRSFRTQINSNDIYDVVRIDETHFGFYIADVVGHGMPAALLTIFLKQSMVLRETTGKSYNIFSPKQVIANLNNKMTNQRLSGHQFATCCYCIVDTKTFEMTYARGGHPYPILIRDGQIQQLDTRGSLLGIFDNADFSESTVSLQKGDKVILFSDGVEHFIRKTDDKNVPQFSEHFLEVVKLPLDELFDTVAKDIKNIDLTSPELDDITVVGFEVK
jgi:sigma-B regulation protein RsbU (phosphoserine phosphatase)